VRTGGQHTDVTKAFSDLVAARQSFLLTGHERPDGDCLGSQVALYHLLRELEKDVFIINPDPVSGTYSFLQRHTPFGSHDGTHPLPEFEVAVLLDCSQLSRLGDLGAVVRASGADVAVVDHHVGSDAGDGAVCLVDSSAAATGVLVYELYEHYGVPIHEAAAEGIFLSLVADTGWFRYSNADARAFSIAARLVGSGVEASDLYDRIHRQHHVDSVRLLESVLSTHSFKLGGKYGYACLDKAAMAEASRIDFDTDTVLEPLRSVAGVEVVALFKEQSDGGVRMSLRASGDVDVAAIARSFGGGGHVKAAGASLEHPMSRCVEAVEAVVEEALRAVGRPGARA